MIIDSKVKISFTFDLTLTEPEARALSVLPSYGHEAFIQFFYKSLGATYLKPHQEGLYSLFKSIKEKLDPLLEKADKAIIAGQEAVKKN